MKDNFDQGFYAYLALKVLFHELKTSVKFNLDYCPGGTMKGLLRISRAKTWQKIVTDVLRRFNEEFGGCFFDVKEIESECNHPFTITFNEDLFKTDSSLTLTSLRAHLVKFYSGDFIQNGDESTSTTSASESIIKRAIKRKLIEKQLNDDAMY